jgi:antitoxin (DNA-binding transcriptional repressor) of toxin-antitoxin stability system
MAAVAYKNYTDARKDFKEVLDEAESGRPVAVQRRERRVALVDAEGLRNALAHSRDVPQPVAVSEASGWSVILPGVPVAVDGVSFDEAIEEFVLALREYSEDWVERLHRAPNHARYWALIQFVAFSSDEQLAAWIRGSE